MMTDHVLIWDVCRAGSILGLAALRQRGAFLSYPTCLMASAVSYKKDGWRRNTGIA